MMDHKTDKLASAIGDIDTTYLEEALDYGSATQREKGFAASLNYLPRALPR